ncbi:MAG TPA: sugar transferase [Actinomycetota bacterium]|nr:sugar transferase [Actinomycetota bacterium]
MATLPAGELPSALDQYRRLYRLVGVTDALSVSAALLVAYWIRFEIRAPVGDFLWLLFATPLVMVVIFSGFRLYEAHRFTPAEEFRRIILAVSLGLSGVVTLSFWSQASLSRAWLGASWAFSLLLVLVSRRLWHWHIWRARREGRLTFPTLIVGTNDEARKLKTIMGRPNFGFRAIGLVATSDDGSHNGLPVLGTVDDLRDLIRESGAECVFVAASALSAEQMGHVAKAVRLEGVEVRVTATLPQVLSSRLSVQPFGGVMAISLKQVRLTGSQAVAKRAFDLAVAGFGLLILSPLFVGVALAVRVTSTGPVLYRQRRVGLRGRPFTMLKFRTMVTGSDAMIEELRIEHGVADLMFKLPDDPRVTPVGRFLRRFSLDELPQLLNVVRGEMTLVGPRPPLPEEVANYEDWQFDRMEVRPGITGLWQVSGRSELSFDECVRLDLFYIENWSLAYDLYIIAKTLPVLVSRRGAY